MAKANRCYTGSRRAVGTPTLRKEMYRQLIKKRRAANVKAAESKKENKGDRNEQEK